MSTPGVAKLASIDNQPNAEGWRSATVITSEGLTVALKLWGSAYDDSSSDLIRVIAVHGWLDNANTWDTLVPWLLTHQPGKRLSIACMDFTGHGLSSHRPAAGYSWHGYISEVIDVADALHWQRFDILGHSMGACYSVLLASIAPDRVHKFISVDALGPHVTPTNPLEQAQKWLRERHHMLTRTARPYASLDEAVKRVLEGNPYILESSVRTLLKRGTVQEGNGVRFRHDPALGVAANPTKWTEDVIAQFFEATKCPVLVLWADDAKRKYPLHMETLNARFAHLPRAKALSLGGGHHLHLDNPDVVGPPVLAFLLDPEPIFAA